MRLFISLLFVIALSNIVRGGFLIGHHPFPSNLLSHRTLIGGAAGAHPFTGAYSSSSLSQTVSTAPQQIQSSYSTYHPFSFDNGNQLNQNQGQLNQNQAQFNQNQRQFNQNQGQYNQNQGQYNQVQYNQNQGHNNQDQGQYRQGNQNQGENNQNQSQNQFTPNNLYTTVQSNFNGYNNPNHPAVIAFGSYALGNGPNQGHNQGQRGQNQGQGGNNQNQNYDYGFNRISHGPHNSYGSF
ncbi:putative uncharacterized protein DDB_G0288537 [Diabrotica virgifera virgifera]|uniref:GATA zinc finger domain-containing protein 14-like n=1 Tax=Diabrotica virgifera virgifera TaxID=50390 RepID=A0ABM5KT19_DIAVI|nr:putative uncharacterized protein DDB_G0288537 [Diabrotica virgifera virgifera]